MDKEIVIAGGGICGVCTAYYLNELGAKDVTLVEPVEIAAAASGKAGGLLALDWHGSETSDLAALSYQLHLSLAKEHDGASNWGFRKLDTVSVLCDTGCKRSKPVPGIDWLDSSIVMRSSKMGNTSTTAQVHPRLFTQTLASIAQERGVKVVHAAVSGMETDDTGALSRVVLDNGQILDATDLVLAAGPWTGQLAKQLFDPKIAKKAAVSGYRAHSIVIQSAQPLSAHALFTQLRVGRQTYSPELYCRPDGTAYVCGASAHEEAPLPPSAADVRLHRQALDELKMHAATLSPTHLGKTSRVVAEQACYLPSSPTGLPLVGQLAPGVYVNSGHTCWGICNSPGSGKLLSELILHGKTTSANIDSLQVE